MDKITEILNGDFIISIRCCVCNTGVDKVVISRSNLHEAWRVEVTCHGQTIESLISDHTQEENGPDFKIVGINAFALDVVQKKIHEDHQYEKG